VERLNRRKARRAGRRLALAGGLTLCIVAAAVVGGQTGTSAEGSVTVAGALHAAVSPIGVPHDSEARGAVEASKLVSATRGIRARIGSIRSLFGNDVGVWMTKGVSEGLVQTLLAPVEDASSAVPPRGLLRSMIVAASVVLMGKSHDVMTNAPTVGALLSAMGIEPDWNDRVSSSLQAPIHFGHRVRFVRVRVRTVTEEVPVPYNLQISYSNDLAPGERKVVQEGVTGRAIRSYRVRLEDGKEVGRRLVGTRVVHPPMTERVAIGGSNPATVVGGVQVGEASWYYSSGMHAAHPSLPFGTRVTVTNLSNGRSVTVVINDRGPFGGRIIDLSDEAFAVIAPLGAGVCQVRLTW
jgi:hypothetical protein